MAGCCHSEDPLGTSAELHYHLDVVRQVFIACRTRIFQELLCPRHCIRACLVAVAIVHMQ